MKKQYGLLGAKLGHSVSPQIHAAFGNLDYALFETAENDLPQFLKSTNLRGLNVTIPYKQTVIPFCSSLDQLAEEIGSVNTMVRQPDGSWKGYNTDAYGLRWMMNRAGLKFTHQRVIVLGNGGVSQTVQAVAKLDGAESVRVISRKGEYHYENIEKCVDATILVNATPVGMYPNSDDCLVDLRRFPHLIGVVELIYNPCRTKLIQQAIDKKIAYTQGFHMLVAQAKQADELFFAREHSASEMCEIGSKLQQMCENIVLIGMPGSGKTTIGKLISAVSGRKMIDTDEEIVRRYKKNIPQIFSELGETEFRRMEREIIADVSQNRGIILVTGGGAVTTPENEFYLRQNGRIYRISREISKLSRSGRPLSQTSNLYEMAKKREPLYAKFADATFENSASPQDLANQIWRDFCAYTCHQWTESEPSRNS